MRIKYYKGENRIKIRLKEEQAFYYDEKLGMDLPVNAYYSEKGDLVEVELSTYLFKKDSKFEEIFIPDKLPWRKYVFTFGRHSKTPKVCADSYNDLENMYDRFYCFNYKLIIQRMDGNEMDEYEIVELRRAIIKDWLEDWRYNGGYSIESVYKDGKLYFWVVEENYRPDSKEDFLKKINYFLEAIGYEIKKTISISLGAILIAHKYDTKNFVCLYDEEKEFIELDKLKEVIKKAKSNLVIISDNELSEDAKKWCEENNIEIKDYEELVADYWFKNWMENDISAYEDPEYWDEVIKDVFG